MARNYGFHRISSNNSYRKNTNATDSMSAQVAKDEALWKNIGWNDSMRNWAKNIDARQNSDGYPWAYDSGEDNKRKDRQSWFSAFIGGSDNVGDPRADQAAAMGQGVMNLLPLLFIA